MPATRLDSAGRDTLWRVNWHRTVDSTMMLARSAAEAGATSGLVEAADYQTQGRGTHGRDWIAPPGACLMFTLLVRPACHPSRLSSLPREVADVIATYLRRRFDVPAVVKEPNDVLIDDRKICGVLCNSRVIGERVDYLLVGIGLNTFMTADQAPLIEATSLEIEGCLVPDHRELLDELLSELGEVFERLDAA